MTRGHIRPIRGATATRSTRVATTSTTATRSTNGAATNASTARTNAEIERMRQALVNAANSEWAQWHAVNTVRENHADGEAQVLSYWEEQGQSEANLEARQIYSKDRSNNRIPLVNPDGTPRVDHRNRVQYQREAAGDNWVSDIPWSAAFIVWCVRQAEFQADEFPSAWKHTKYIHFAKENRDNDRGVFRAYRLTECAPQAGDIVCLNRNGGRITYDRIRPHGESHCDIVTEVTGALMTTIGGNVFQNVGKREVELTNTGHIPTDAWTIRATGEPGAGRRQRKGFFAILRFAAIRPPRLGDISGPLSIHEIGTHPQSNFPQPFTPLPGQVRGASRYFG